LNEVNKSIGSVVDIEGRSNDLKTNLTKMLSNYDELIKMDKSKADSLNIEKSKIQGLLNQINTLKNQGNLTYSKLLKMERENETLREIMKGYIKEIDQLNQLNKQIQTDLDETSEKLTTTETERDEYH
jgi:uncharacterized coiled-coil DUF342 family protein